MTLERIAGGDIEALALLLRECWAPLVRYLTSLLGSVDAAEDAAQEAFIRLWTRRERWQGGSARAVLYHIGRNIALDVRRKGATQRRLAPESDLPGPWERPQERVQEHRELEQRVAEAIQCLPPARREVFELVRLRGLRYAEVAEILDLAPQTVANHMSLALRDLRSLLENVLPQSASSETKARARSTDG